VELKPTALLPVTCWPPAVLMLIDVAPWTAHERIVFEPLSSTAGAAVKLVICGTAKALLCALEHPDAISNSAIRIDVVAAHRTKRARPADPA
jgi:hypothetical protein